MVLLSLAGRRILTGTYLEASLGGIETQHCSACNGGENMLPGAMAKSRHQLLFLALRERTANVIQNPSTATNEPASIPNTLPAKPAIEPG
jgi:hypothetical protein